MGIEKRTDHHREVLSALREVCSTCSALKSPWFRLEGKWTWEKASRREGCVTESVDGSLWGNQLVQRMCCKGHRTGRVDYEGRREAVGPRVTLTLRGWGDIH